MIIKFFDYYFSTGSKSPLFQPGQTGQSPPGSKSPLFQPI